MQLWQSVLIFSYGLVAFVGLLQAYKMCRHKKNTYGHPPKIYGLYAAFVWADLVIFGLFWTVISLLCLILQNAILFLLFLSLFWLVRSIGETLYWFHQQFTPNKGNPPEKFLFYHIFPNDSVWFVFQIYWQCITVITIVTSMYLAYLWISQKPFA